MVSVFLDTPTAPLSLTLFVPQIWYLQIAICVFLYSPTANDDDDEDCDSY